MKYIVRISLIICVLYLFAPQFIPKFDPEKGELSVSQPLNDDEVIIFKGTVTKRISALDYNLVLVVNDLKPDYNYWVKAKKLPDMGFTKIWILEPNQIVTLDDLEIVYYREK